MKSRHVASPAGQGSRDFIPAYYAITVITTPEELMAE